MNLELIRYGSIPNIGTFGEISVSGMLLRTAEREWKDNTPFVSCIPAGEYKLVPYDAPKFGNTYCMVNEDLGVYKFKDSNAVRYGCLIHVANWPHQLSGCIGVGRSITCISGDLGVTKSRVSMDKLISVLGPRSHTLTIRWAENERVD